MSESKKQLLIQIKIPLPNANAIIEKIMLDIIKKMFPTDKLPAGSTVEYQIEREEKI